MQAIQTGRQEYPMKGWLKGVYLLFGLFCMGFGIVVANLLAQQKNYPLAALMGLLTLPLALYFLALALRSRLVIDGTRVEVHYAFTEKTADLSEIEGYRTISTRNGSYWQLKLKEGRGTISVSKSFDCEGVRAWLAQIPNLDERDRKAVLDEIEQNQELGATPEERMAKLAGAKQLNYGLMGLAIVAALGFGMGGATWRLPSAMVLAVVPVALIYLAHSEPLLYTIIKPKRDPRSDVTIAFLVSGFGLIFGNHGAHFVETPKLLEYAGLAGLLCCTGIYAAARKNAQFWGAMIGMLFIAGMYGWGLAAAADTVPDKSAAVSYTTTVVNKHVMHGRSTSYYLDLAPWGPMQGRNEVSVSSSTYQSTAIGEQVCLELRPGVLRVQWYRLVACNGSGQ